MNPLPGELMIIGFNGTEVTPQLSHWITERHVGGVVLFGRNLVSMAQVSMLIDQLQGLRATVSPQPLFIAIDQEGGVVSRIIPGMTVLPGNMALGAIDTEDCAYAAGRITAVEMGLLGFNVNFGPVADMNCDPKNLIVGVRSFGDNPQRVGCLASAMIEGLQDNGMLASAKHFPGLGHCHVDPHYDLPIVVQSEESLLGEDVLPFKTAIAGGVHLVMSAHAVFRCWESDALVPATFSERILKKLLREKLGFQGVVVSDDLEMGALCKYFTPDEIARRCIQAGVDLLLVCHSKERQRNIFEALQQISQKDSASGKRMEESLQRIRAVKNRLRHTPRKDRVNWNMLGIHGELADRMGRDSITLWKDEAGLVPIEMSGKQTILIVAPRYEQGEESEGRSPVEEASGEKKDQPVLLQLFQSLHSNTQYRQIEILPNPDDFALIESCRAYDLVILLVYNAHLFPKQMEFAKQLLAKKKEVIVVAIRNPYDLSELKEASTALATYGFRDCSMKGLVEILFGETIPKGKMPVRL